MAELVFNSFCERLPHGRCALAVLSGVLEMTGGTFVQSQDQAAQSLKIKGSWPNYRVRDSFSSTTKDMLR